MEKSTRQIRKEIEKADANISKIFNPENKFKRTQKKIIKEIFEK